jgi:hypothetical protein
MKSGPEGSPALASEPQRTTNVAKVRQRVLLAPLAGEPGARLPGVVEVPDEPGAVVDVPDEPGVVVDGLVWLGLLGAELPVPYELVPLAPAAPIAPLFLGP